MAAQHHKIILSKRSPYVGQQCPISYRKLRPGDEVVLCVQTNTIFTLEAWEQTLPLWGNTCQYCQTQITGLNVKRPAEPQLPPTQKSKSPLPLYTQPAPLPKSAPAKEYELIRPKRSGCSPWLLLLLIIGIGVFIAFQNAQTPTSSIRTNPISVNSSAQDSGGQIETLPFPTPTTPPENISTPVPAILPTETWTPAPPQPSAPDIGQLQQIILGCLGSSGVPNQHRQQAEQLIAAILQHLREFQLLSLGITEQTMRAALTRCDRGDRINSLVQEVWEDWLGIARNNGFDPTTMIPDNQPISPFRKLVVRLIQGRQGRLSDSQQHAIYNFFTRAEEPSAWYNNIDGVIGAVNRESFLWP